MSKLIDNFENYLLNKEWDNDELIEIIKLAGAYLNLKTIPDYAKENNMSYQGVKTCRTIKEIFGVKFVIDNF